MTHLRENREAPAFLIGRLGAALLLVGLVAAARPARASILDGTWAVAQITLNGEPRAEAKLLNSTWTFKGDDLLVQPAAGARTRWSLSYDLGAEPPAFRATPVDAGPGERPVWMILSRGAGELRLAFYDGLDQRPEDFGPRRKLVVLTLVTAPRRRPPPILARSCAGRRRAAARRDDQREADTSASRPGVSCALERDDGAGAVSLTLVAPPAGPTYAETARREVGTRRARAARGRAVARAGAFSAVRSGSIATVALKEDTAIAAAVRDRDRGARRAPPVLRARPRPALSLRADCLALAIGVMAVVACSRDEQPGPPLATRIATLETVSSSVREFVDSLALAPDAGLAATGERGGRVQVWSTAGERGPLSLGEYREAIVDLAFSPDGRLLASLGRQRQSALRLWRSDGAGGWVEAALLPVGRCPALRFDGTGTRLGVLCESEVLIVDPASLQEVSRLANPHREVLTAFDLSADGQRLVTAGHDGEVTVRDVVTTTPVRSFNVRRSRRPGPLPRGLEPPEVWPVVVALSGGGARAAVVTIEGTVYVWDVATGKPLFDHADGEAGGPPAGSLRFARDGTLLTTMGDRYGMRRIEVTRKASRIVVSGPNAFGIVAINDDATAFAAVTSSARDGRLRYSVEVWRMATATAHARD